MLTGPQPAPWWLVSRGNLQIVLGQLSRCWPKGYSEPCPRRGSSHRLA